MKRITKSIIAVFAITTMLFSCSKDDKTTDPMQGKWTLDNIMATIPNVGSVPVDIDGDCADKNYFDLKTAGALEQGTIDPDTCELTKANGTWKKTNNSVEFTTPDDGTETLSIVSVTATKLVLKMAAPADENLPAGTYAEFTLLKK